MAYGNMLKKAQEYANKIIDELINENSEKNVKNRIAVVSYNGYVRTRLDFSDDKELLKEKVNRIYYSWYWDGGAYTQEALKTARDMLEKDKNGNSKNIVILSYGKSSYAKKLKDPEKVKTKNEDEIEKTTRILGIPFSSVRKSSGVSIIAKFLTLNIFDTENLSEDDFDYGDNSYVGNGDDEHAYYDLKRTPNSFVEDMARNKISELLGALPGASSLSDYLVKTFTDHYSYRYYDLGYNAIAEANIARKKGIKLHAISLKEDSKRPVPVKEKDKGVDYDEYLKKMANKGNFYQSEPSNIKDIFKNSASGFKFEDDINDKFEIVKGSEKINENAGSDISVSEATTSFLGGSKKAKLTWNLNDELSGDAKTASIKYRIKIKDKELLKDGKPVEVLQKPIESTLTYVDNSSNEKLVFDISEIKFIKKMEEKNSEDETSHVNEPKIDGESEDKGKNSETIEKDNVPETNKKPESNNASDTLEINSDTEMNTGNTNDANKTTESKPSPEIKIETEKNLTDPASLVGRISGRTRFETAVELSKKTYKKSDSVVIANAYKFPDVLSSSPYASSLKAPILFVDNEVLPDVTMDEIIRLGATKVVISGGTSSVSPRIERELRARGIEVTRLGGTNRYQTSKLVAQEMIRMYPNTSEFIVANGQDYPDALAVSSLASKKNIPIILSDRDGSNEHIKVLLENKVINNLYIAGGMTSVPQSIESELRASLNIGNLVRYAGFDRYETASIIAKNVMPNAKNAVFASGEVFADALAAGSYANKMEAPIVLIRNNMVPDYTMNYLMDSSINHISVVGGDRTISQSVANILEKSIEKKADTKLK